MAMTWLYGALPQLLSSLYFYALSYEQIKSLQGAREVTLSQAIRNSQIPPDLINIRNTIAIIFIIFYKICHCSCKSETSDLALKNMMVRIFSMSLVQVCLRFKVIPMLFILVLRSYIK